MVVARVCYAELVSASPLPRHAFNAKKMLTCVSMIRGLEDLHYPMPQPYYCLVGLHTKK